MLRQCGNKNATDMNAFLQYAGCLVVWGNHDLDSQPIGAISNVANSMTQFGIDKVIMTIGLWDNLYSPVSQKSR